MSKSVRMATFDYLDGFAPNQKTVLSGWGLLVCTIG